MESLAGRKAESVLSCPAFRRQQEIFSQSRPEQEQPVYVYVYIYIYIYINPHKVLLHLQ